MQHVAILENTKTGRFHPLVFNPAPRPSDDVLEGKICRHRSIGHHTDGFDTFNQAVDYIKNSDGGLWLTGLVYKWSGDSVPAATADFPFGQPIGPTYIRRQDIDESHPNEDLKYD